MENGHCPERLQGLWEKLFPGQIPDAFASAEALSQDEFDLEGEKLMVVRLGHTDCDETTALWVPSAGLLVAVYGSTYPYMGESGPLEARLTWITASDKLAALKPMVVVGGHTNPNSPFGPGAISQTRTYLEDFNRTVEESQTAEKIYARMMDRYPSRLNPGSLWAGAALSKPK
ncbi:hypothetical protein HFD88_009112 [Aspergillus terreus]|nr:hypothetical protein HFD88_009112 [Aspergillus terreus]